jgi:hypothetical protein
MIHFVPPLVPLLKKMNHYHFQINGGGATYIELANTSCKGSHQPSDSQLRGQNLLAPTTQRQLRWMPKLIPQPIKIKQYHLLKIESVRFNNIARLIMKGISHSFQHLKDQN